MRKKYILFSMFFFMFSCDKIIDQTPKCNDEKVKNEAVRVFIAKIRPDLIQSLIDEEINESDLREYAYDKGLNVEDVLEKEKEKLKKNFSAKADVSLQVTKIQNIRTEKLEKDIHKCNCVADIENTNLKPIKIFYTAQKTEDSSDGVYVETTYELKE